MVWESDPQGYTHGWGDLHLKPRDAAKLGYLWLNHGLWDGKQIVPAAWVEDSVTPHSKAGDENYGYGWWVEEEGFYAMGRAGQSIKVYPSWKLIIVTTASNLEYDQINPYLVRAFVSPDKPLPPNPAGIAQLNEALATLTQTPFRTPVKPQPDNAKTMSGKTYLFEPNPVNVENLRFVFDDSAKATMYLRRMGSDVISTIGLDGNFRLSSDGLGLGGYWEDTQTFVIQVFDIGLETLQFHFEEDRLLVEAPGLKFEGKIGNPE